MRDVVVIGAGLAGLVAAARLVETGNSVTLVSKGLGGLQLGQGTIDVLGYRAGDAGGPREFVEDPLRVVDALAVNEDGSDHPYRHFSGDEVSQALEWLKKVMGPGLLTGDGSKNYRLPTALGALRPTALPQPSMISGQPDGRPIVLVGFERFKDFYPDLVAENLRRQKDSEGNPIQARAIWVDLVAREGEVDTSGIGFARALDRPEVQRRLCELVKPLLKDTGRPAPEGQTKETSDPRNKEVVGFPAVLGIDDPDAWRKIADCLGHDVFEVPVQPPSVPGMRLNEHLLRMVKSGVTDPESVAATPGQTGVLAGTGARIINGAPVIGFDIEEGEDGKRLTAVIVSSAGHPRRIEAKEFVLATGGFESGAIKMDSYDHVSESLLDLPLAGVEGEMIHGDYWGKDQPLFKVGLRVDPEMRPLDAEGIPVFSNLRAAGGIIGGSVRWREKSGDGVALVTGLRAADSIAADHNGGTK